MSTNTIADAAYDAALVYANCAVFWEGIASAAPPGDNDAHNTANGAKIACAYYAMQGGYDGVELCKALVVTEEEGGPLTEEQLIHDFKVCTDPTIMSYQKDAIREVRKVQFAAD